jgi:putative FmdB family regulatory protein
MPMYDYFCAKCHKNQDAFRSVSGRDKGPACKKCGHQMKRIEIAIPTTNGPGRPNVRDPFQKV